MNHLFSTNRTRAINRPVAGVGLARKPVSDHPGQPPRVRGLTFPLNVTNVSTVVLPADFDRRMLFLQNNDSVGVVYLSFGVPAVIGQGIRLGSSGGGILLDVHVPTCDIYAIGSIVSNINVTASSA